MAGGGGGGGGGGGRTSCMMRNEFGIRTQATFYHVKRVKCEKKETEDGWMDGWMGGGEKNSIHNDGCSNL